MLYRSLSRILTLGAFAFLMGTAACDNPTEVADDDMRDIPPAVLASQAESPFGESFRVYTRNIYLGGNTALLFTLDFSDVEGVMSAVQDFWGEVESNNFQERARAIAAEIAMSDPHVVALQEVARYDQFAFDPSVGGYAPSGGGLDMWDILRQELALAGADYTLAGTQVNTSGMLPYGGFFATTPYPAAMLQFALREVTLVRSDLAAGAEFANGTYQARLPLGPLDVTRGWSKVTVDFRGVPHNVVNTHLETQAQANVQIGQTEELINSVTAGLDGVTIVMGDLNSNANAKKGDASWTPTYDMMRDAGFADAWLQSTSHEGRGWTCCHDPDLRNATPSLEQRIDFVLYRSDVPSENGYAIPGPVRMTILGDESGDQTESGLWPADHAALFAGFAVPPGLAK